MSRKSATPRKPARARAKTKRSRAKAVKHPPFDKYDYYLRSVQSPDADMRFLSRVYRDANGAKAEAKVLREDFCGTFANCCAWVSRGKGRVAHGIDLDPEPLAWGRAHHLPKLKAAAQERVHIHKRNVLGAGLPKADAICALNFSYFIFKDRPTLLAYFKNCRKGLRKGGVLVVDCFGGTECLEPLEEMTPIGERKPFYYYWDQMSYDPLSHFAKFAIHFRRSGERKRVRQFTYDWRMWTPPEIKDLMLEAGFKTVLNYWEGTTKDGEGDGRFTIRKSAETCKAWVTYLAATT